MTGTRFAWLLALWIGSVALLGVARSAQAQDLADIPTAGLVQQHLPARYEFLVGVDT